MNVVIYARFSSHNQNEQSIEGQLNTCYEFAKNNGYTVIGEYIDRALSGTTDNRPQFLKMIEDSSKKHFQAIIVYQLDRFTRNRYDSAIYKAKLKKNNVRVLSARENITNDASGILIEGLLESMAEYYSAELSQKIKRGMDINASKCLATGGNVALGFRVDENKHFQIDDNTAPVVVKIFEMYATGSTMAQIIRYLNGEKISTSHGNEFNKNSINRILRNKRYIGVYTYNETETPDVLPRIIPDTLFYEVQNMIDKKKKAPARAKATVDYILTTKLFCGHCRTVMTGGSGTSKNGTAHHYYQCVTNRRDKSCTKKSVKKDYIEDLVINETRNLLTDENIAKIARDTVNLCEREKNTDTLKRLQKKIRENEKAMNNLVKALADGRVVDVIYAEIEKKQAEKRELEQQLTLEMVQHPQITFEQVKFFMEQFKSGDINDMKYRQALIDTFVDRIYLYDDKMTILYNAQDSHSDVDLDEMCSSAVKMVEATGVEPVPIMR